MEFPPLRTVLILALAAPGAASAHAILMESQPAAGVAVPAGAMPVTVRFNSRIDHGRSRLTLRQGQTETVLPLQPGTAPDRMAATATVAPGAYTLRWQVLALDGHVTRGDVPFTVRAP